MQDKWHEFFNKLEQILIRLTLLIILVVGLLKILGPEIYDVYNMMISMREANTVEQPKVESSYSDTK